MSCWWKTLRLAYNPLEARELKVKDPVLVKEKVLLFQFMENNRAVHRYGLGLTWQVMKRGEKPGGSRGKNLYNKGRKVIRKSMKLENQSVLYTCMNCQNKFKFLKFCFFFKRENKLSFFIFHTNPSSHSLPSSHSSHLPSPLSIHSSVI